jgi:peptidoglycan L-alanyl-D-glutamate endopeptidase CwlK
MDNLTIQRIQTLHPKIRAKALEAYTKANNVLGKGVRLRFSQVYRTAQEQDALYAQGRTKPGKRVTNARAFQSHHCHGLAMDIVLLYDKDGDGNFEEVSWDMRRDGDRDGVADWLEVTRVLEAHGFKNGFITNGKKWDFPHFQMDFGYNWRQLKALIDQGKVIKETIEGREYIYPII